MTDGNKLIQHFQHKYVKQRIGEESLESIREDIITFKSLVERSTEEEQALWWLKCLLVRGEAVFATYKERPTGDTND